MGPVIRIDDDVYRQLQAKARPFLDKTPNDVLRRMLALDKEAPLNSAGERALGHSQYEEEANLQNNPIFIVINAAGEIPDSQNALNGYRLVQRRVKSGVDVLAYRRFVSARKLSKGTMILMHQGGATFFRNKYGAGQLVAAGRIKEVAREITDEDKERHLEDYKLTKECFPKSPLVGIMFYEFPKGMASQPLPKEAVPYYPGRGDNFIRIEPGDKRYPMLLEWWKENF
jgi:negative regulator of replication initiation